MYTIKQQKHDGQHPYIEHIITPDDNGTCTLADVRKYISEHAARGIRGYIQNKLGTVSGISTLIYKENDMVKKVSDCTFATTPKLCKVLVWDKYLEKHAWVLSYLCSDGLYHFDEESLHAAEAEFGCSAGEMYVNTALQEGLSW